LKIVEKSGNKLEELLTSVNPWQGADCQRPECLLCETKKYTVKLLKQESDRRNLVYETYCITCLERDTEEIMKDETRDKEQDKERIGKIKMHKYVGDTNRSLYER
jgi:hypothetical protein